MILPPFADWSALEFAASTVSSIRGEAAGWNVFRRDFFNKMKTSGFVASLIEKHGVKGRLTVAPPG